MIATEGFDEPSIDTIVMARPTKSRSLYAQMLGRGTRPLDEIAGLLGDLETDIQRRAMIEISAKPHMTVLDFVGNTGRHEIVSTIDIFGEGYDEEEVARAKEIADERDVDAMEALELSREEVEKKRREAEQRRIEKEERLRKQAELSARQALVATGTYRKQEVMADWSAPPDWCNATEGQIKILRSAKVPMEDIRGWTKETIGELCRRIVIHRQMGLCTYKQAKLLRGKGWPRDVLERMSFEDASAAIDAIAKSGWRLRYKG
jgi:type I site-specific restriction endonuclease